MSRSPARSLAAGLAAVAVIAGASFLVSASSRRADREVEALRVEVKQLRREGSVAPTQAGGVVPASSAAGQPAVSAVVARRTPEERQRYYDAVHTAQKALLHRSFEAEPVDAAWSSQARAQLSELYHKGSELRALSTRIDCRTSMCRVDFSYTDAEAGPTAVQQLIGRRPWSGRGYSSYDTAKKAGFYYLTREGHEMPRVNPKAVTL